MDLQEELAKMQHNAKFLAPSYYTKEEGGKWLKWLHGDILTRDLEQRVTLVVWNPLASFSGIQVHSFLWGEPSDPDARRWDCLNGWTDNVCYTGA